MKDFSNAVMAEPCPISPREREVLHLIAHEKTSKEIASELYISTETVLSHRKNLMNKMKVRNVAGMVRVGMERGLVCISPKTLLFTVFILFFSFKIEAQYCLNFDGVNDLATGSTDIFDNIGSEPFIIEFTIKADSTNVEHADPIMSNRSGSNGFMIFFHDDSEGLALAIQLGGTNYLISEQFTNNYKILDNQCHEVIISRNDYDLSFWVDGISYGTIESSNVYSDISNSTQHFSLGYDANDGTYSNITLSEVRIKSSVGVLADWQFDEGSGFIANDQTENNYNLHLGDETGIENSEVPQWSTDCCSFTCSEECDTTTVNLSTGYDINGDIISTGQHQSKWKVVGVPAGSGVDISNGLFPYILPRPSPWESLAGAQYISPLPDISSSFNNLSNGTSFDLESCFCVCADNSDITIDLSAYADNALNVDLFDGNTADGGSFLYDLLDISSEEGTGAFNGATFDTTVTLTLASGQYCLKSALQNDGTVYMGLAMNAIITGAGLIESECCSVSNGLTGFFYDDKDCNGSYNRSNDALVSGVQVSVLDANNATIETTSTDQFGLYTFSDLGEGAYTIDFTLPQDYEFVSEPSFPVMLGATEVIGNLNFGLKNTGPIIVEPLGSTCASSGGQFTFDWCGQSCDCSIQIFAKPCGTNSDDILLIGDLSNLSSYTWNIPADWQGDFEFVLIDCDDNEYPFEGCLTIDDYSVEITASKVDCGIYSFDATLIGSESSITSYSWSFGDYLSSSAASPTQDFPNAGEYRICVTISTADGCSLRQCINLDILEGVDDDCNYCPPNVLSEIENGDLFIHDDCYGVIMQSPNGSCFRITVTDEGQVLAEPVECP